MNPYNIYSQAPVLDRIVKNWDLKTMVRVSSSSKKNQTLMEPIIEKKREELESYVEFLNDLGFNSPKKYCKRILYNLLIVWNISLKSL